MKKIIKKISTTRDLAQMAINRNTLPIPEYSKLKEANVIAQPRGSIFSKIQRTKGKMKIDL